MTGPFRFTRFPIRSAAALSAMQHLLRASAGARIHLLAALAAAAIGLFVFVPRLLAL